MKEWADLIRALAACAWPLFAFISLYCFRNEFRGLLERLKRGKVLGQDFEFAGLDELDRSTKQLEKEVAALPAPLDQVVGNQTENEDVITTILRESARSPKAALLLLSAQLEREVRHYLAATGRLEGTVFSLRRAVELLANLGVLPAHVGGSLALFTSVRNSIVHGGAATNDDILRAIDSGITILKAIEALPQETNTVLHPGVDVFTDANCEHKRLEVRGIMLETTSPGGTQRTIRIYPTTKTHFQSSRRVAWEWNSQMVIGESWYRDPQTQRIHLAWGSSMEFVGRHLDDV